MVDYSIEISMTEPNPVVLNLAQSMGVSASYIDAKISDLERGVTLVSANGTKYILTVENDGNLITTLVD